MKRDLAAALFIIAGLGVVCLGAASAFADVPTLLSYQGVLTDGAGVAVPDGPYSVTFRLYDVPSGGTALWTETDVVQVSKGTFSATLGLVADLGSVNFDMDYYLGLSISGGEELPRTMLTTAPYSFTSRAVIGYANIFPSMGSVGIGTKYPDEKLHVAGAIRLGSNSNNYPGTIRWTGADFEGYDGSVWKSLTATGGSLPSGGAGQTLRHDGSNWAASSNLYNNGTNIGIGTTSPAAKLHVGGDAAVGSMSSDGALRVYRSGLGTAMAFAGTGVNGGEFRTYDEAGNGTCAIQPDFNGTGGFISVGRNATEGGFVVDGNFGGTGSPYMGIAGPFRGADFDMSLAGDGSVMLPLDAISSGEILNEAGVASTTSTFGTTMPSNFEAYLSQTITAPTDGYVIVTATADIGTPHENGTLTQIIVGVSTDPASLPATQHTWIQLPESAASGAYHYPVTVSGMFQVSPGANTFYLVASVSSGSGAIYERNLSLLFVPTAYGSYVAPLTSAGSASGEKQMGGRALTAGDITATRAASEAANTERIQAELDAMKERLAKVEAAMKNGQGGK